MESLSVEFGLALSKGETVVIGQAKRFVQMHGADRLGEAVKLHFKTTKQVLCS